LKFFTFAIFSMALVVSCAPAEPEPSPAPEASPDAPPTAPDGTRESPYMGHGIIQEVGTSQLVIQHETIPGFMAGMTMAFPVTEEVMSGDLEVGDEIMFDIELLAEGYQIFNVDAVEAEDDDSEEEDEE
jgi:Cu/Ag efflux protein CusF